MRDSKNFLFPPALTIVFLAHCAGLFATPAQAQVITLVRNTGQSTHSHARCNVGINSGEKYSYAQGFTTGDNEDGYTLSQVVAVVSAFSDISPRISIYTGTGGKPDSNLYTLNNPGTFSTGDVTFTAPPNATLEKETKYFVVLEQTSTSGYYTLTGTGANNEDSGGVSGWSIADGRLTRIGSGQWAAISPFEIKIKIKGIVAGNSSPVFSTTSATLNFQETEGGATTRTAGNVGAAVVATDADNDTITYTLKKGTDADKFRIVRTTGRIRTKAGERYDYEAIESYSVTAKAKDGNGGTATIDLTIDITDQDEPPLQMQAPTVENPSGIHTALDIRGTAPENTGRPPITGYLYRWRRAGTASWTSRNSLTSLFRAVGLTSGREYELQVQAINDEGDGVWSPSATAHTTAPATGEPAISGTARVGQTLTADISNISDANGLANVVWIYRWRREDSDGSNSEDISGATSSAYVLAAAEGGKKVRVRVSFTDDAGFDEVLTSDAYPSSGVVEAANSAPVFTDGASMSRGMDEMIGNATVSTAAHIGAAVSATDSDNNTLTYTLEGTDADKFGIVSTSGQIQTKVGERYSYEDNTSYSVTVKADDGNGGTDTIALTIDINDEDEPPPAPAAPSVSSASTTSLQVNWTAPDNAGRPSISGYAVRYGESGTNSWTSAGSNFSSTAPTINDLDEDTAYDVQVRATNAEGDGAWSASGTGSTGMSTGNNPAAGKPTISGVAKVGEILTASTSGISDSDGKTRAENGDAGDAYTYQWVREDSDGANSEDISGATSDAHTLVDNDEGKKIKVKVSFTDDNDNAEENIVSDAYPTSGTVLPAMTTSAESEEIPTELTLWDNYPNPFNPETVIDYVLPQTSHVRLAVYDMTGKTVAVLMDGIQPQGRHTARFNADGLPTGTYVYRLIAGAETLTRTMTLVR